MTNYLENFTSAEVLGNKLLYHFSCTRCGSDYLKSSISQNNGLCPMCKSADAKKRAKIAAETSRKKAASEIRVDLKRVIQATADKHSIRFNNTEYVQKDAVIESINNYFNQQ